VTENEEEVLEWHQILDFSDRMQEELAAEALIDIPFLITKLILIQNQL